MLWKIGRSSLAGEILVPPSKSHTIRALLIAALCEGESVIEQPLLSGDGESALSAARGLGAEVEQYETELRIRGIGRDRDGGDDRLYLGNSGTSTRLFAAAAALGARPRTFDGDASLRTRPMMPLLKALQDLGARWERHVEERDIPFTIWGPLQGGHTRVQGLSSQFVSSLLLCAPLLPRDTTIDVYELHERPYVEITLWWLDKMGVRYKASQDRTSFTIKGMQSYAPITQRVPGDFSSATFPAVAAALTGSTIRIRNIDFSDPQGDKEVFTLLEKMGAKVKREGTSALVDGARQLKGIEVDCNSIPDALPALAVLGTRAEGKTILTNVRQARIKECDRIDAMCRELTKMGARVEEHEDGMTVYRSNLVGCRLDGRDDHRVVMALALAGMIADGETIVETAEAAAVTFPGFVEGFSALGAAIEPVEQVG
jgi:3-phosphoshikimate 1-carboxyvinyltransferase